MENVLIFIKHHFAFLWRIIECGNGWIFSLFYKSKLEKVLPAVLKELNENEYSFRRLKPSDAEALYKMINMQTLYDLDYFHPHRFDLISIKSQFENHSFLMMGAFEDDIIVGYFFLRFFINRKCFVGRLIDKNYRGRGIGEVMNKIMYETAWGMKFHCMSTISRRNKAIMKAHSKNQSMIIRKELQNDYLLVEFVQNANGFDG